MILAKDLELVVADLNTKVKDIMSKEGNEKSFKKAVIKYIESDEYFFNILTSALINRLDVKRTTFMDAGIDLMRYLEDYDLLYYLVSIIETRIRLFDYALKDIKEYNLKIDENLVSFIDTKKLPKNWSQCFGVCVNLSQYSIPYSTLTRMSYILSNPFILFHYPIQDNSKAVISGGYDYHSTIGNKYKGDNLFRRIKFAEYIIELHKHYNSK